MTPPHAAHFGDTTNLPMTEEGSHLHVGEYFSVEELRASLCETVA